MILHIDYVYTSEFERYYFNQCIRVRLIENLYINTRHSHLGDSCKKKMKSERTREVAKLEEHYGINKEISDEQYVQNLYIKNKYNRPVEKN
jgi:hypothetical protein